MEEYTIIMRVFCEKGEENLSINKVSNLDLEVLDPLFKCIREHRGFFPTGIFMKPNEPTARDLYRPFSGWDILRSLLPEPPSGIQAILEILVYKEPFCKMSML